MKEFKIIFLVFWVLVNIACGKIAAKSDLDIVKGYYVYLIKNISTPEFDKVMKSGELNYLGYLQKLDAKYIASVKKGELEFATMLDKFAQNPDVKNIENEYRTAVSEVIQRARTAK